MTEMAQYREFRQMFLAQLSNERCGSNGSYQVKPNHRLVFSQGRSLIQDFRYSVANQAKKLISVSPENEVLVRRALRLFPCVSMRRSAWSFVWQVALSLLPTQFAGRRLKALLSQARSYQGRKFLFEHFVNLSLPGRVSFYDEALDFALTQFESVESWREIDALSCIDIHLLRAARQLGLTKPSEVIQTFPKGAFHPQGQLLQLLISEDVIRTADEICCLKRISSERFHHQVSNEELLVLRHTIQCLRTHGVDREEIARIVRFPLATLKAELLADNLRFLVGAGIKDISGLLVHVDECLWRTPTFLWRFVVQVIGAQMPLEVARYRYLLECCREPSEHLVQILRSLGASQDDLVTLQPLIAEVRPDEDAVATAEKALRLLAAPPHNLSFAQLALCRDYVRDSQKLEEFLNVLRAKGFSSSNAVLQFQHCFVKLTTDQLERIMSILGGCGSAEADCDVVAWVLRAAEGGWFDSYDFLVNNCDVSNLASLRQALTLVPLGVPFLKYLVHQRGMGNLKKLRAWYYGARGIHGYKSLGSYDQLDLGLVDDAFSRNRFNLVATNMAVVDLIVQRKLVQRIGQWPWQAEKSEKDLYTMERVAQQKQLRHELVSTVDQVLQATGGVLLPTLFDEGTEESLDQKLARLSPLLDDLMVGGGPSGPVLSPLEVDAIALIFCVSAETVASGWASVQGYQEHTSQLRLSPHYLMEWQPARWQLKRGLDRSGFAPLLVAGRFCKDFMSSPQQDILTSCKKLSPKQLRLDSNISDLTTLALHLGSLLVVVRNHDVVRAWVEGGFEGLAQLDENSLACHQRIGELVDLFDVVLPDALHAGIGKFVEQITQADADHWAIRLGPCKKTGTAREKLSDMLQLARTKVLPHYSAWARRQYKRYSADGSDQLCTQQLRSVVTKHPAAFFARAGVQLCTAGNVEMWLEKRLLHLVVFDPEGRRMAGMALLYVQQVPEIDRVRRSLIIRAINPTDEMLGGHTPASIVESFLQVAVRIAKDNDLACVAFPAMSGMHLMSNRAPIETYLRERYVMRSAHRESGGDDLDRHSLRVYRQRLATEKFYAYENGREPVDELFVIWKPPELQVPLGLRPATLREPKAPQWRRSEPSAKRLASPWKTSHAAQGVAAQPPD